MTRRSNSLSPLALIILGLLAAAAPLSTDLYLSAFPQMASGLGTSPVGIQLSLTTFLIGSGVGQVLFGPWSDRAGRMTPLVTGLGLYVAASIVAAMAPNATALIVARLFQGIGASAGMGIGRAMIVDRETGSATARALNVLMMITGIAPIVAPVVGSLMLASLGWRGLLWVLVGLAALSLVATVLVLRETLPASVRKARQAGPRGGAASLLRPAYVGGTLSFAFAMGVLMAYISASPFVYQQIIGLDEVAYGIAFGVNAIGVTILTVVASKLSYRVTLSRIALAGIILTLLGVGASFLVVVSGGSGLALMITLFLAIAPLGLVMGTISALAISAVAPESTGLASALLGLLQFALAGAAAGIVGVGGELSAAPMLVTMASCAILSLAGWIVSVLPAKSPATSPAN